MPFFKDSYETTVGSVLDTKRVETSLKESFIKDSTGYVNLNIKQLGAVRPVFITGYYASEADIPLFTHPITILDHRKEFALCTDLRFFIRKDTPLDNIRSGVKNLTEFNFSINRTMLSMFWLNEESSKLKNNLQFAGTVFSAWLAEAISKTYALDFKDQTTLAVITSYYYQSLFSDKKVFDEDEKQRMTMRTMKDTKAPAEFVFQIFDKIEPINDINDYVENVVRILENVRLKNFNLPMLLTIVKNSWYGTSAKEIISVALEHPPTWCAVVFAALSERTYKTSMIYRIAERFGKRGGADEFMANFINMLKELKAEETPSSVSVRAFE